MLQPLLLHTLLRAPHQPHHSTARLSSALPRPSSLRFQIYREVRLHASLNHENVVQLWAAFQEGDKVVMVQVSGGQRGAV